MSESKATIALNVRLKSSESSTHLRGDGRRCTDVAAAADTAGVGGLTDCAAAEAEDMTKGKYMPTHEGGMSTMRLSLIGMVAGGLVLVLVTGCAAGLFREQTVAERFEKAMKKLAERCTKNPPKPGNTDCDPLKLKPADPLATQEGRFAHSIKIPNPVHEDSGYKPEMTTKEYFEHLCKTEAGEFIFKTVEEVEGIMQMRPRIDATDYEMMHLYALEDPYNVYESMSEESYVNPRYADAVKTKDIKKRAYKLYKPDQNYKFLEKPIPATLQNPADGAMYLRYTRPNTDKLEFENGQYMYPRDQQPPLLEERVKEPKSRYGFTWRGITRPHDREMGVVGGEVIVLDLQTNEVLAVRRGYAASGGKTLETVAGIWWLNAAKCPAGLPGVEHVFIHKVLKPSKSIN